jgi:hypothetical protein
MCDGQAEHVLVMMIDIRVASRCDACGQSEMIKVRHWFTGLLTLAVVGISSAAQSQTADGQHGSKAAIGATHPDVSFFVVGKSTLHKQDAQGSLGPTSYYLFGEVFLRDGGQARAVKMTFPKGQLTDFTKSGAAFRIKRRDFATLAELDQAFPDGTYTFDIDAPGGRIASFPVSLKPRRSASPFPAPLRIAFTQSGKSARQDQIDPKLDLVITWTTFATGQADSGGTLGDVSFVIMSDCSGAPVARSELPFKATPALSYADREFRVPAERLAAASVYKLHVEHAELVDVKNRDGVVGLATFPTVTDTALSTAGARPECTPSTKATDASRRSN